MAGLQHQASVEHRGTVSGELILHKLDEVNKSVKVCILLIKLLSFQPTESFPLYIYYCVLEMVRIQNQAYRLVLSICKFHIMRTSHDPYKKSKQNLSC